MTPSEMILYERFVHKQESNIILIVSTWPWILTQSCVLCMVMPGWASGRPFTDYFSFTIWLQEPRLLIETIWTVDKTAPARCRIVSIWCLPSKSANAKRLVALHAHLLLVSNSLRTISWECWMSSRVAYWHAYSIQHVVANKLSRITVYDRLSILMQGLGAIFIIGTS